MGRLVRMIGSGIGLASEAIASRKSPQESGQSSQPSGNSVTNRQDQHNPQYVEVSDRHAEHLIANGEAAPANHQNPHSARHEEGDTSEESDEEHWELDRVVSPTEAENSTLTEAQITDEFMRSHPPPSYNDSIQRGRLPCPVIIPQRRPGDKKRGFVRAYAPVLEDCGISQATFLDFLKSFHAASKASPWINIFNLAALGLGFVPTVTTQVLSIAINVAVGTALEVQTRTRSHSFLDTTNKEFFQPRGLYCLIMTYKPQESQSHERIDITQTIVNSMNPKSGFKEQFNKLKVSSGQTQGEVEMPEAAPLVFPDLVQTTDGTSTIEESAKKDNSWKSSQKFVANYKDRQAQARYAAENPNSTLAANPESLAGYTSRYSDPSHPANSGSLIALVTGGAMQRPSREERRRTRAERRGREPRVRRERKKGPIRKMLKPDVLYMMIVNLPTEQEVAIATSAMKELEQHA